MIFLVANALSSEKVGARLLSSAGKLYRGF